MAWCDDPNCPQRHRTIAGPWLPGNRHLRSPRWLPARVRVVAPPLCSLTTRRSRWWSGSGPPPAAVWRVSRNPPCARSPSSSRCCPSGCVAVSPPCKKQPSLSDISPCRGAPTCSPRLPASSATVNGCGSTANPPTAPAVADRHSPTCWCTPAAGDTWRRDDDQQDWRTFRADRLSRIPNGGRFATREPPAGGALAYIERSLGSAVWGNRATATVYAQWPM